MRFRYKGNAEDVLMFPFCSEPPGEEDIWGNGLWTLSRRFRLELKIPFRIRSGADHKKLQVEKPSLRFPGELFH